MDLAEKPALQRRRLLRRLTRLRVEANLSQLQVSKHLRWSQSKVNRVENGEVGVSYTDLKALLELYRVNDQAVIETMARMADIAKRPSLPGLSEVYADRAFRRYLELEEMADRIWQFENARVPGLLQTERYARAVLENVGRVRELSGEDLEKEEGDIDKKVAFRLSRQQSFDDSARQGALTGSFVLDEAVIRRAAGAESGDASVMVEQLQHLKELSGRPGYDIGVIPFGAGLHLGLSGPFVVLNFPDFPDVDDAPLLYIENALGDFATSEETALTSRFSTAFEALREESLRDDDMRALLDRAIADLTSAN